MKNFKFIQTTFVLLFMCAAFAASAQTTTPPTRPTGAAATAAQARTSQLAALQAACNVCTLKMAGNSVAAADDTKLTMAGGQAKVCGPDAQGLTVACDLYTKLNAGATLTTDQMAIIRQIDFGF